MNKTFHFFITVIVPESVGCFKDSGARAVSSWIGNFRGHSDPVTKCLHKTLSLGFTLFGVQYGGECFSGADAHLTYAKYGPANNCVDGLGGGWANDIYRVPSG